MKRITYIIALTVAILIGMADTAYAVGAKVAVPVVVDEGGVVVITPVGDAPSAVQKELVLTDGERGEIELVFDNTGTYEYIISIKDEGLEGVEFDKTVYKATVAVFYNDDASMYTTVVITKQGSEEKPDILSFENEGRNAAMHGGNTDDPAEPDNPTNTDSSNPTSANANKNSNSSTTSSSTASGQVSSRPKTGDSSNLVLYLLIATASSAGLLILSLAYAAYMRKRSNY